MFSRDELHEIMGREFTLSEMAQVLGVSRHTVRDWLQIGRVRSTTLGDIIQFAYELGWRDAEEAMREHMSKSRPPLYVARVREMKKERQKYNAQMRKYRK